MSSKKFNSSLLASTTLEEKPFRGRLRKMAPKAWRVMGFGAMATSGLALGTLIWDGNPLGTQLAVAAYGTLTALLGTALAFAHEGVLIDFDRKMLKQYTNLWGIDFGEWERLPAIELVKVAPFRSSYTIRDGINPTFTIRETTFKVSLFFENDDFALPIHTDKREKALATARLLSEKFRVNCYEEVEEK
jgi:hypothetical protein